MSLVSRFVCVCVVGYRTGPLEEDVESTGYALAE